jgi:hypothetical protein
LFFKPFLYTPSLFAPRRFSFGNSYDGATRHVVPQATNNTRQLPRGSSFSQLEPI